MVPVQIFPSCTSRTDVLLLIGAIYYQLGSYEQCIAFNDRCILLDPHMAEAHANLANALQQIGNWDMAIIYYKVRALRQQCITAVQRCVVTFMMTTADGALARTLADRLQAGAI